ncbi:MAG: glycosyltransferase, partial [Bacteroidales bacterium]
MKISAVVITYNEEKNIDKCLSSLKGMVDDIVVVDSFSTDKTKEICLQYDVNFYEQAFLGYGKQKNKGHELALHDWILSIDADEVLDSDLRIAIQELKNEDANFAYQTKRLTNYCGEWIYHCGWYPDIKIRLFNKNVAQWSEDLIHETLIFSKPTPIKPLAGHLLHYSYHTISDHLKQADKFTTLTALAAQQAGKKANILSLVFRPCWKFIRDYFLKLGFLDGYAGFTVCSISAFATFLKYSKLRLLRKNLKKPIHTLILSRIDALGDVLLSLPLAALIKESYPQTRILFLGRNYTQALIEAYPYIDGFINWDTLKSLPRAKMIEQFKSYHADVLIHVYPQKSIAHLAKKAQIPLRIGTSHRWYHWIYCNKLLNFSRKNSPLHESCLNTFLLKPLGITRVTQESELVKFAKLNLQIQGSSFTQLLSPTLFNVVLHPKSKGSAREWGLENFAKLIELLPPDKYKIFIIEWRKCNEFQKSDRAGTGA